MAPWIALYLAFAAKLTWPECLMALVAATLAAGAAGALRKFDRKKPAFVVPPATWLMRLPGKVVLDGGRVIAVLMKSMLTRRPAKGRLRNLPFDTGGEEPHSITRRAWVTVANSLTPSTSTTARSIRWAKNTSCLPR
ncbi:MAG: hypothetical protein B7Z73_10565 [Planctomycetia bacterium 21-64-5]|nr:MAG: hypothetical protein B7Z73_10565 [Planctomycetia bacterium 21-64-5]